MRQLEYLIIGAGFGGLGMAIRLRQNQHQDFEIWEKAADLGGCWRDNIYPGAACDVPSHLYSFSFAPKKNWSHKFAPQAEILDYMKECAERYQLSPHIKFNREITEARFDEDSRRWQVTSVSNDCLSVRYLISATGQLNRPAMPNLPGLNDFKGERFHSAQWREDVDLKDKKVIVIGTGASAIQFVPEIAKQAKSLSLFQRSAPYVITKPDRRYSKLEHWLLQRVPGIYTLSRLKTYIQYESRFLGFRSFKQVMRLMTLSWRRFMHGAVKDESLRQALTPNYPMGCKRILIANNYYPSFERFDIQLNTRGIEKISPSGVIDNTGVSHEADVLIFGTGFKASELLSPMRIIGRNGLELNEAWKHGAEAFLGITVTQFPNFFMLYGPNTNLGHNSIIYMLESQINYTLKAIAYCQQHQRSLLDVLPHAQQHFNNKVQQAIKSTVWSEGCSSWYQDAEGKHTINWPGFTFRYRHLTRQFNAKHYLLES